MKLSVDSGWKDPFLSLSPERPPKQARGLGRGHIGTCDQMVNVSLDRFRQDWNRAREGAGGIHGGCDQSATDQSCAGIGKPLWLLQESPAVGTEHNAAAFPEQQQPKVEIVGGDTYKGHQQLRLRRRVGIWAYFAFCGIGRRYGIRRCPNRPKFEGVPMSYLMAS